ncbi:unnamed protein product [Mytilus edulis]|uniref:CCHC-type domain-containing protein n=1 Tax=Mytilus edulis TaxID=6550 RepID=A0A8S3VDW7_MYTED|nr:unnamed protein product [Mytilus edulis]
MIVSQNMFGYVGTSGLIPEETAEELLVVDLAAEQNIPVRINMPGNEEVNIVQSIPVQPNKFSGNIKSDNWVRQFIRWKNLQKISDEQACYALPFYLEGAAKTWFEGLAEPIQTNFDQLTTALKDRFKNTYEDDDILLAQLPTEKAVEFLDRLQIKANNQNIPEHLLLRIAKKGFQASLKSIIVQRDPKTIDELRTAAIIAEKCHQEKENEKTQVSAISNENFQFLQDTINVLTKKVENLDVQGENKRQQPNNNFGNSYQNWDNQGNSMNSQQNWVPRQSRNWGQQNRSRGQQSRNWGQQSRNFDRKPFQSNSGQQTQYSGQNKASCTICGMYKCSGNPDNCFARDKQCDQCKKIGHFAKMCRSIYNKYGERIRY